MAIARYFEEANIDQKNDEHLKAYCDKMCDVSRCCSGNCERADGKICVNPAAVFRRATNITEDAPVASQVVPAPEKVVFAEHPSSDVSLPASLAEVHNSALLLKSQSSARSTETPHKLPVRTPIPIRPSLMVGSATSTVVPSPLHYRQANDSPRTPAHIRPNDRKGKRAVAMTIQDFAEGSYAVPDEPPTTKKKREQQHHKFMSTEAVQGDGPYGYYAGKRGTCAASEC